MQVHDTRTPASRPLEYVDLGLGAEADLDRRLIGPVGGRKILELGCGGGHAAVGLAMRGARVVAVDESGEQLAAARELAIQNEVSVEFHQTQLAELAFMTADQIDLAFSVTSLSFVEDLERVIRQVQRVIKVGGHLLISVPHPGALCADPSDLSRTAQPWHGGSAGGRFIHNVESLVSAMRRAKFVVDNVLERHVDDNFLPSTLIARSRKT